MSAIYLDITTRLRGLANCDSRAGEPLGKCMREAVYEIERLRSQLFYWKCQYEDEKRNHEATLRHAERQIDKFSA